MRTGIYTDKNFDSVFDPKIIKPTNDGVQLWIKEPGPYKNWQTSELVSVEKVAYGRHLVTARADCGSSKRIRFVVSKQAWLPRSDSPGYCDELRAPTYQPVADAR
jgi:hypothetical protein